MEDKGGAKGGQEGAKAKLRNGGVGGGGGGRGIFSRGWGSKRDQHPHHPPQNICRLDLNRAKALGKPTLPRPLPYPQGPWPKERESLFIYNFF